MRELDDVEHAEKQREADRHQGIHHAEHQPVHDVLRKQPEIHVLRRSNVMPGLAPGIHVFSR